MSPGETKVSRLKFSVSAAEQVEIEASVRVAAGLGFSYVVLLMLSTLIATFGLISNSTATVIGAMIVAPLMGPILGIALSLVQGDLPAFRRSFSAELVGVLLCLLCATSISKLLGPEHIDLTLSEIAGRTHPTLLDLAIGFSAGLAGAFATVNRRISNSIAGVAIAVALVPPLCVSGLCLGAGQAQSGLGAFVLFLANFLTIQLASAIVFSLAGLGHWENLRKHHQLMRAFALNLLLLLGTGYFLSRQLALLVAERRAEQLTRQIVLEQFQQLAGARLDNLNLRLRQGSLEIELLARAPEEISVSTARQLQKILQQRLGYSVQLRIATARASFVTPDGHLFLPEKSTPSPQEAMEAEVQRALTSALEEFPGSELINARLLSEPESRWFVLLRSPFVFDSRLVSRLQSSTLKRVQERRPEMTQLSLTVRTSLVQDYTEHGLQVVPVELPLTEDELQRQEWERQIGLIISAQKTIEVLEVHVASESAEGGLSRLSVDLRVRSPRPLAAAQIEKWRRALSQQLGQPVGLSVQVELGQSLRSP